MRSTGLTTALMIASMALIPAGCSRGAERSDAESADDARASNSAEWNSLRDFTAIDVVGPDNVIVTQAKDFSIRVEGDPQIVARLKIKRDGDTLEIGRRKTAGINWSDDKSATIRVTMPRITSLELTGSGDISADRVEGGSLKAELTGTGNLHIAAAKLDTLKAELTGSGDVEIGGASGSADISITGTGDFKGEGLKVGQGKVSILGTGGSNFASDGPVDIDIMGTGDAVVKGKAQCRSKVMGTGEARCAP